MLRDIYKARKAEERREKRVKDNLRTLGPIFSRIQCSVVFGRERSEKIVIGESF